MDFLTSIAASLFSFFLTTLPWSLTHPLVFLLGCWFYRWMLKRDPQKLENLVQLVNQSPELAKSALDKVTSVASALTPDSAEQKKG